MGKNTKFLQFLQFLQSMQQPQIIVQQPVAPTGDEEYQCGTKDCWIAFTCACLVLAVIMLAVPIAKGGCTCTQSSFGVTCVSVFDGCAKGGALSAGAAWGMVLCGVALLIITCVGCCGVVPCCCFKKDIVFPAQTALVVPIMPAPTTVALGVNDAPPPPPPSDPGKSA